MPQPTDTPNTPNAPRGKLKPMLPYSRDLRRAAWWAWLTVPDEELAERFQTYHADLPPWLDSTPWLLVGMTLGLLLGAGLAALSVELGLHAPTALLMLLVGPAFVVAMGLARRDRRGETASHFPARLAMLGLHLFYLLPLIVGCAAVLGRELDQADTAPMALVCALAYGALVLMSARATTPLVFRPDFDEVWPSVVGIDSLILRIATAILTAVTACLLGTWPVAGPVIVVAFVAVLTLRLQEHLAARAAERIADWLPGRSLGRRRWIRRFEPAPFLVEALLLSREHSPEDWQLAAAYSDARDYPPDVLSAAGMRLWSVKQGNTARARAAAVCALELWTGEHASPEAAYRGFVRLDTVATHQPAVLDEAFWTEFGRRTREPRARAQGVLLLLSHRAHLPVRGLALWRLVRTLGWTAALAEAPDLRADVLNEVLAFQRELASPPALAEWWDDVDTWAERHGWELAETILESVSSRGDEVTGELLGGAWEVPANTHRHYVLALRHLALAAGAEARRGEAAMVTAWYEAARRFEALPAARQRELIAPFGWLLLWRVVAVPASDAEELARQRERYRRDTQR